jgi:large subunit ribosomal protein L35
MPKIKTHRGAAKRFSLTGTGKVKRSKAYASHILTTKTKKRKRNLRKSAVLDHTNEKAIKKLLPYM